MTKRDPRHRIGLHHSNHLIDVTDTWPATRRRRFPFGLRRDPLRGWVVSEAVVQRGELKEITRKIADFCYSIQIGEGIPKWWIDEGTADIIDGTKMRGNLKATQYAEYRIKRGYVSPLSKEEREGRKG